MFAALAVLALMLKLLVPAGFMPGTTLSQPIVLCPGQGPMPAMPGMAAAMEGAGRHDSGKSPHGTVDHPCAFAGLAAAPLAPDLDTPALPPVAARDALPALAAGNAAPGRGLAAPPPPSHAPPANRA